VNLSLTQMALTSYCEDSCKLQGFVSARVLYFAALKSIVTPSCELSSLKTKR